MREPILPGKTIGILGGGQLGKMTAQAAQRMGYRVHVYCPESHSVAGNVADEWTNASFDDQESLSEFARSVDIVTLEFENIPTPAVRFLSQQRDVYPGEKVLYTAQDRIREKELMQSCGIPVAPFRIINSETDLHTTDELRWPCMLKSAQSGYDGKGQCVVEAASDLKAAWESLGSPTAVLEQRIDLASEFSVLVARNGNGATACYDPVENTHRNQILDLSISPSLLDEALVKQATDIAIAIADELELIGLICVEYFLDQSGQIMVNEIAPRPHNSGHLTIEGHFTSQFEQHVRAVCGLKLGATAIRSPAAMVNLLGDLWKDGKPNWNESLGCSDVYLHLYGKLDAKPGRKMGHLTALGQTREEAAERALAARDSLGLKMQSTHQE